MPVPEPLVEEVAAVEDITPALATGPAIESEVEEVPEVAELAEGAIPEEPEVAEAVEEIAMRAKAAQAEPDVEEVEPARMPVSLTATLREQGHRYYAAAGLAPGPA